jgi:2-desacetyl-2-hydroxyethyl bacteriochlorophyllide A dehydrogenase
MTARRLHFHGQKRATVDPFAPPALKPGDGYRIDVHHSLISPGTEMLAYRNAGSWNPPFAPGYTCTGRVVEAAPGMDASLVGKLVYLFPGDKEQMACHASQKVTAADALLVPLPEGVDPAAACFARMVNIVLTPFAVAQCHRPGGAVLVIGLGLVGQFAVQVAKLKRLPVIAVDTDPDRRDRATGSGADVVLDPAAGDLVEAVKQHTQGRGADLAINASGVTATFLPAIRATATGGELSTLGSARTPSEADDLRAFLVEIQNRHITVRGGWEMLLPRRTAPASPVSSTESHLTIALQWIRDGRIRLAPVWTHRLDPDDVPAAYAAIDQRDTSYLGVTIKWKE